MDMPSWMVPPIHLWKATTTDQIPHDGASCSSSKITKDGTQDDAS